MFKKIKKFILDSLDDNKINFIQYYSGIKYYKDFKKYKNKKKIIYTLIPSHGNMGDQAIAYATMKYLKDNFSEYEILEVYREDTYKYLRACKMVINKDDIILLHGGGNMGNLYPIEERDRRFIIKKFKNNKIISMTQTISFSSNLDGKRELEESKKIYNNHKDLTIIAREKKSYEIMNKEFNIKNIILNPDIVFYLSDMYEFNKNNRNIIMTCLRSDKESILGEKKTEFITQLNKNYKNVVNYDTVINEHVLKENREKKIKELFQRFLNSKVVITDRLHGMVFCVITKTPCIATKSLDHKVVGTYEWIKSLNYIKLVDDLEYNTINPIIEELCKINDINNINFKKIYFEELRYKLLNN